jgi:hypothetical protein
MRAMWKRIIPVLIGLGVVGLLVYQLLGQGGVECRVCMTFNGRRNCATARGPGEKEARSEAQNSACSRIARGMTDSTDCQNQEPEQATCRPR